MAEVPLPEGFSVGHATDERGRTGCTVVLAPPEGARGGGGVIGGGPGTRETDILDPAANADRVSAVVFAGGSAFGLAAADGVVSWLAERGLGYETPAGRVPIVPAAVVYDLAEGDPRARPGAGDGHAACDAARPGVPERGLVGAGTGTAAGKILGRPNATPTGIGYAAWRLGEEGPTLAAVVVVNPVGEVVDADGSVLAGPRDPDGRALRTAGLMAGGARPPVSEREATTLACVCTDAPLSKVGATVVARMAGAGITRAVVPALSPFDGDAVFVLAAPGDGEDAAERARLGAVAAEVVADAIRDAVRSAAGGGPATRRS